MGKLNDVDESYDEVDKEYESSDILSPASQMGILWECSNEECQFTNHEDDRRCIACGRKRKRNRDLE